MPDAKQVLSEKTYRELVFIKVIDELQKSRPEDCYQEEIAKKMRSKIKDYYLSKRHEGQDIEVYDALNEVPTKDAFKGFITRNQDKIKGVERVKTEDNVYYSLPDQARELMPRIESLLQGDIDLQEEAGDFKQKFLRWPDKQELSQYVGRKVKEDEYFKIEGLTEPDKNKKAESREKSTQLLKYALAERMYQENDDKGVGGSFWKYYIATGDQKQNIDHYYNQNQEFVDQIEFEVDLEYMDSELEIDQGEIESAKVVFIVSEQVERDSWLVLGLSLNFVRVHKTSLEKS